MADIIAELASKTGVSAEQARQGLGTVLSLVKEHIPAESFSRLTGAIPGADRMMAAAQEGTDESGGILAKVSGMAGKIFGGGSGATALVSKLTQQGFSAEQIQTFIPSVFEFLKNKLPGDVMKKLDDLLPADVLAHK
jgi:hypothetical protein